jgi:hypothetical protein
MPIPINPSQPSVDINIRIATAESLEQDRRLFTLPLRVEDTISERTSPESVSYLDPSYRYLFSPPINLSSDTIRRAQEALNAPLPVGLNSAALRSVYARRLADPRIDAPQYSPPPRSSVNSIADDTAFIVQSQNDIDFIYRVYNPYTASIGEPIQHRHFTVTPETCSALDLVLIREMRARAGVNLDYSARTLELEATPRIRVRSRLPREEIEPLPLPG